MTNKINRREFINAGVGMALGAFAATNLPGCANMQAPMAGKGAETIFRGGTIITMHDKAMSAEAVAEAGGRRERT